jgi:hypothetical protein
MPMLHLASENRSKPVYQRKQEYLAVMRQLERIQRLRNVSYPHGAPDMQDW